MSKILILPIVVFAFAGCGSSDDAASPSEKQDFAQTRIEQSAPLTADAPVIAPICGAAIEGGMDPVATIDSIEDGVLTVSNGDSQITALVNENSLIQRALSPEQIKDQLKPMPLPTPVRPLMELLSTRFLPQALLQMRRLRTLSQCPCRR